MSGFAEQVASHIPALRRYARALLGDPGVADDLVQDCLERALSRAHLWRRPDNLRAWLFTIMHNLHANHRRRLAQRPPALALDGLPEPARPATQIEGAVARETLAAVRLLSDEHRQVLLLVGVEGLSYAETAGVLAVPVGTVMSRLSRARERLRQLERGEAKASARSV
jgi:RNA polymerase sigma-70 factor (ECF subfamily)